MPRRNHLRPVLAAAALLALAGDALGQACARNPRADAGDDVQRCIPAVGTTDVALAASRSLSHPLNGPITQYCWTTDAGGFLPGGGVTSCSTGDSVVLRLANTPGRTLVHVRLVITDASGCTDDDEVVLDLATPPVVTRAEASDPVVCLGEPLDLLAAAVNTFDVAGLVEYAWDFDASLDSDADGVPDDDRDAVVTGVSGRLVVASFTPPRPGRYVARLVGSVTGDPCTLTAAVPYEVLTGPSVRQIAGPVSACPGMPATFRAELAFGGQVDMTWDFDTSVDLDGDGDPANDVQALGQQVSHAFTRSARTTLRVTATGANSCSGFLETAFDVLPAPVPAFTTSGPGCGLPIVTFTDVSTGTPPLTISWDFGDGSLPADGPVRTHVFSSPGTYAVSHLVANAEGCIASETRLVDVQPVSATIEGVTMFDGQPGTGSSGNADGFADPGERVRFAVDVRNPGSTTASGLIASLASLDATGLVSVTDDAAEIPALAPGGSGATLAPHLEAFVDPLAECGSSAPLQVRVAAAGAGACATTRPFTLRIGAPGLQPASQEVAVTTSPFPARAADAVGLGGAHAVVVIDESSGRGRAHVLRFSSAGARLPDGVIADDVVGGSVTDAQAAWSPASGELAIAWVGLESASGTPGGVARLRRLGGAIAPTGTSTRLDAAGGVGSIDVAWAGDHWLVAWTERSGGNELQLRAQVVTSEGLLLGSPIPLGAPVLDGGRVRAASSGDRVLVAHRTGTELRLFTLEGLRPASVVRQQSLTGAAGTPSVSRFGAGFLVAFESGGGVDVAWLPAGGTISRSTVVLGGAQPSLASDDELTALAWQSGSDVFARVLGATGAAAGASLLVSSGPEAAESPALSAADGLLFAAYGSRGAGAAVLVRGVALGPALPDGCLSGVLGDVAPPPGGDGRVDVADVVLVLRAAVGLTPVTAELLSRGDVAPGARVGAEHRVQGDGVVDVADAVVLLQAASGLVQIVR